MRERCRQVEAEVVSKSQAGPDRKFTQPRDHFLAHLCTHADAIPYFVETRLITFKGGIPRRPRILAECEGEALFSAAGGFFRGNVAAEAASLRAQLHSGRVFWTGRNCGEAREIRQGREEVEELHGIVDNLASRVSGRRFNLIKKCPE